MDFLQVKRFLNRINQGKTDIDCIKAIFEINQYKGDFFNLDRSFENSNKNLNQLKNLYKTVANRHSTYKRKMFNIAKGSKV